MDSKWLPLATASILGQPPRVRGDVFTIRGLILSYPYLSLSNACLIHPWQLKCAANENPGLPVFVKTHCNHAM